MKMFNMKKKASRELSSAVEEFLANGGAVTKIKPKPTPKNIHVTKRGLMGPRARANGNDGKSA